MTKSMIQNKKALYERRLIHIISLQKNNWFPQ